MLQKLSHLKSRTVLLGVGAALLGGYYQLEDAGVLPMYLTGEWMARLTMAMGALTWYFRVNLKAPVGKDGRITPAEITRLQEEAKAEARAELLREFTEARAGTMTPHQG